MTISMPSSTIVILLLMRLCMQVLIGGLMPAVAPLALDKDKDVRTAAVAALHVIVARAVKEAEVTAAAGALSTDFRLLNFYLIARELGVFAVLMRVGRR